MKSRIPAGMVIAATTKAKAENRVQRSSSAAIPVVRLTKGIHHVQQNLDNYVGIGKFLSAVDGRLGTVGGGRAQPSSVLATRRIRDDDRRASRPRAPRSSYARITGGDQAEISGSHSFDRSRTPQSGGYDAFVVLHQAADVPREQPGPLLEPPKGLLAVIRYLPVWCTRRPSGASCIEFGCTARNHDLRGLKALVQCIFWPIGVRIVVCPERGGPMMKDRLTLALAVVGSAVAVALAAAPTADASPNPAPTNPAPTNPSGGPGGSVAMPPGGPIAVYPQDQIVGGADPYTPFGTDPLVPYGSWTP
jgi:hypothetical protein